MYGKILLLRIDNTTALAYVNNMGETHVSELNDVAQEIWNWCEDRKLWIYASYIPSKENRETDQESRVEKETTEWELADSAFKFIEEVYGPFQIDLFATRINTKCKIYCSWYRDPDATFIDAFTFSWHNWLFYAFPPFAMILKTLRKIIQDKAEGVLVVPLWVTQPWFPVFSSILIEKPIILNASFDLLTSPFRPQGHPLASKRTLVAGKLSGKLFKGEELRC